MVLSVMDTFAPSDPIHGPGSGDRDQMEPLTGWTGCDSFHRRFSRFVYGLFPGLIASLLSYNLLLLPVSLGWLIISWRTMIAVVRSIIISYCWGSYGR